MALLRWEISKRYSALQLWRVGKIGLWERICEISKVNLTVSVIVRRREGFSSNSIVKADVGMAQVNLSPRKHMSPVIPTHGVRGRRITSLRVVGK